MKKTKPEYERAILSAKKQFILIAGKEAWYRESLFLAPYMGIITTCEPESVKQSLINIALTGVTINPIFNEAYLRERDGKCFLDFTYRGLIKIATSEGAIISLSAGVVYTWDEIKAKEGTNAFLDVTRNMNPPKDPDEIARNPKLIWAFLTCSYAVASFPNGQESFVVLPKWKCLKVWQQTSAKENPIHQAWPEEFLRKTSIIYFSKTIAHTQRLATAVSVINEHEGMNKKEKPQSRLMKRMKK